MYNFYKYTLIIIIEILTINYNAYTLYKNKSIKFIGAK